MSREHPFEVVLVWWLAITALVLVCAGVVLGQWAVDRYFGRPSPETRVETNDNPTPIFRCNGAGGGVVVSLGGDGKSIYVFCDEVKP